MLGKFITFEGGEGAGKSTQIKRLTERLNASEVPLCITREPGGSAGAEALRHVLLSGSAKSYGTAGELLLFAAARLDHMRQTILPALRRGEVVLCDRFYDSTRAYQGCLVDDGLIDAMERVAVGNTHPDLTVIFDIDPEVGLERVAVRAKGEAIDRFEQDDLTIHRKRRESFLKIARENPTRCVVVDASLDVDALEKQIWAFVQPCLLEHLVLSNKGFNNA